MGIWISRTEIVPTRGSFTLCCRCISLNYIIVTACVIASYLYCPVYYVTIPGGQSYLIFSEAVIELAAEEDKIFFFKYGGRRMVFAVK